MHSNNTIANQNDDVRFLNDVKSIPDPTLLSNIQKKENLSNIENNTISQNLIEYLENQNHREKLLSLQVHIIYSILNKYGIDNFTPNNVNNSIEKETKIMKFMLKYLKKHGREASFIFSAVDFIYVGPKCIRKLVDKFYDVFDFHFLSSNMAKIQAQMIKSDFLLLSVQSMLELLNTISNSSSIEEKIEKIQKIETILNSFQMKPKIFEENFILHIKKFFNQEYEELIEDIASKFYSIDDEYICQMNEIILNDVLSSKKIQIKDENSLLQILIKRRSKNENCKFNFFFDKVQYEYVDENVIKEFVEKVEFEDINKETWNKIKIRLICPIQINPIKNQKLAQTSFYNKEEGFNGIFKYLTNIENNVNIIKEGIIKVESSEIHCGDVKTLFDFNGEKLNTHITANEQKLCYIIFDLINRKAQINSYLIKEDGDAGSNCFLKNWKIEVSNDKNNWILIDKRSNVVELDGKNKMENFEVEIKHEPFRYFRLLSNESFSLANFEIYGKLIKE